MKNHSIRWLSLVVFFASWSLSNQASASFHVWDIVEAFSSADGSVQFIEMFTSSNNQHLANTTMGRIFSNANSFSFPTDLPSGTTNKTFLVGTTSYEAIAQIDVNVPLPDYVVVDNFFSIAGDTLRLEWLTTNVFDTLAFTAGDLPIDGTNSLNHAFGDPTSNFSSTTNSPTNFAQDTGTVTISANFDGDDDVDGEDFLIWQRFAGGPGGFSQGDANLNGIVDEDDLANWEAQYGLPIPLSAISAIPEPQSVCLLLWGLLALSGRRRVAS